MSNEPAFEPKGVVIPRERVKVNVDYETTMRHYVGICKETCNSDDIQMSYGILPAHTRTNAHVHINADMADYIIQGRGKFILGWGVDERVYDLYPGVFTFAPRGEIHVFVNEGDEDIILVGCYDTNSGPSSGKVIVENR